MTKIANYFFSQIKKAEDFQHLYLKLMESKSNIAKFDIIFEFMYSVLYWESFKNNELITLKKVGLESLYNELKGKSVMGEGLGIKESVGKRREIVTLIEDEIKKEDKKAFINTTLLIVYFMVLNVYNYFSEIQKIKFAGHKFTVTDETKALFSYFENSLTKKENKDKLTAMFKKFSGGEHSKIDITYGMVKKYLPDELVQAKQSMAVSITPEQLKKTFDDGVKEELKLLNHSILSIK